MNLITQPGNSDVYLGISNSSNEGQGPADTTVIVASYNPLIDPASPGPTASASSAVITGSGNDTIQISGSNTIVDAGLGMNNIFILDGSAHTFVLHANGTDVISGFSLASHDVLDMRPLLSDAKLDLRGDIATLGLYVHVTKSDGTASVSFDPSGTWNTAGSTLAVLQNVGSTITALPDLIKGGELRIA